ncbi:MAG: hypothetical protein BAJALOKI1v1_590008 [Promethearchaeota archaeon]|nr:MAG: hypothetical protein BAJALOKI1v1_590008 [Candidatus Lokiarchaeota archaeon]
MTLIDEYMMRLYWFGVREELNATTISFDRSRRVSACLLFVLFKLMNKMGVIEFYLPSQKECFLKEQSKKGYISLTLLLLFISLEKVDKYT